MHFLVGKDWADKFVVNMDHCYIYIIIVALGVR